ncbi:hypothetical protein CROQUDRAFT_14965, partial [Cronartium quercuum f. sp. fusiforme G11]
GKRHGAIFNVNKTKWMIFSLQDLDQETMNSLKINFGNRSHLLPENSMKWLGITIENNLSFRKHRKDVIAKGLKRANFLSSLSNTRWGIPPKL